MMIAGSKDVAAARRTVGRSLDHLLAALHAGAGGGCVEQELRSCVAIVREMPANAMVG